MTGWALTGEADGSAYGLPELLGDGSSVVARMGRGGESLRVMEAEDEERILAEVTSDAETPPFRTLPVGGGSQGAAVPDRS
ncbi:hypothetical protein ABZ826_05685 [Streptomyces sp. NPDC047515]|uniref:hypothetical protein n=1 Tax=Streptomyces sp. NPDC047515 TaxID=3155380 RepID=UPI00340A945C